MAPKDPINGERERTFAPGEQADGSINAMTEDEAAAAIGVREADEDAFDGELEGDDPDDLSDLDDEFDE